MRGTSVLNIDCYWLNERVCVNCPLVRAVTDTRHLSVSWMMCWLQLDTWAQDAVWCGPLVTELPALKSLKRIPELWIIITFNTPTYKLIFMVENKDFSAHHWQAISECPINEWINASYVALSGWRYIAHCSRQRQWKLFHSPLLWQRTMMTCERLKKFRQCWWI